MLAQIANLTQAILGFDAFCLNKKFLVFNLVDRNLKVKYRRSFFGFFWTILSPLAMSAIYYFVFKLVLKVDRPHYLPFILCGVLPWAFFVQSLTESTESLVANQSLISKIPIPIQVFPYVVTLTNFSTLAFSLPVIYLLTLLSGVTPGFESLLAIYFMGCLLIFCYSLGAVLSIFYVYLRDLRHALSLIIQIWFYATPILYDRSMIPEKYQFLLYLNPVGPMFSGIQCSMLGPHEDLLKLSLASAGWCALSLISLRLTYANFRKGLVEVL